MPIKRLKSTKKAQWSSDTLSKAKDLMRQGHSMRYAAKAMNMPISSLQKRLKMKDLSEPRLGRRPIFTENAEKILADRVKYLSSIQIRKAAFRYAQELKIPHNFDSNAKMAGRDWLFGFLKRNRISIRKPANRLEGFVP